MASNSSLVIHIRDCKFPDFRVHKVAGVKVLATTNSAVLPSRDSRGIFVVVVSFVNMCSLCYLFYRVLGLSSTKKIYLTTLSKRCSLFWHC